MGDTRAILEKLGGVIRTELNAAGAEITRDTTSDDVDGWDSLAHARLMLAVESSFDIHLPGGRLFDLREVGDLVDLIDECQKTEVGDAV